MSEKERGRVKQMKISVYPLLATVCFLCGRLVAKFGGQVLIFLVAFNMDKVF